MVVLLEKFLELVDTELAMCPDMCPDFICIIYTDPHTHKQGSVHSDIIIPYIVPFIRGLKYRIFALECVTLVWWVLIRKPTVLVANAMPPATPLPPPPPKTRQPTMGDDAAATPLFAGWGGMYTFGSGSHNRFIDNRTMYAPAAEEEDPNEQESADFID
jgi:hypothetical protein